MEQLMNMSCVAGLQLVLCVVKIWINITFSNQWA